jgi:hypothetical protein
MEKVKRVHVDGPGVLKDRHGGLDQGTKGWRMDHGWLALGDIDKQVYMRWSIDDVDQSQDDG